VCLSSLGQPIELSPGQSGLQYDSVFFSVGRPPTFFNEWDLLIVDDEPDGLAVTKLALKDVRVFGLPMEVRVTLRRVIPSRDGYSRGRLIGQCVAGAPCGKQKGNLVDDKTIQGHGSAGGQPHFYPPSV
jgi:hypothetical protein